MNKFIYWVGIYTICVAIHDFPYTLRDMRKELEKWKHEDRQNAQHPKEKAEIGVHVNKEGKPINRIGFSIEAE